MNRHLSILSLTPLLEHIHVPELAKRNIRLGYTPNVLTDAGSYSFALDFITSMKFL